MVRLWCWTTRAPRSSSIRLPTWARFRGGSIQAERSGGFFQIARVCGMPLSGSKPEEFRRHALAPIFQVSPGTSAGCPQQRIGRSLGLEQGQVDGGGHGFVPVVVGVQVVADVE